MGPIRFVADDPQRSVRLIIALALIIGGLYIVSPFYVPQVAPGVTTPIAQTLTTQISLYVFGFLYATPGFMIVYGTWRDNMKTIEHGLYWAYIVILFTVLLIWIIQGLFPMTWLSTFALGLIAAVKWIRLRWEAKSKK